MNIFAIRFTSRCRKSRMQVFNNLFSIGKTSPVSQMSTVAIYGQKGKLKIKAFFQLLAEVKASVISDHVPLGSSSEYSHVGTLAPYLHSFGLQQNPSLMRLSSTCDCTHINVRTHSGSHTHIQMSAWIQTRTLLLLTPSTRTPHAHVTARMNSHTLIFSHKRSTDASSTGH